MLSFGMEHNVETTKVNTYSSLEQTLTTSVQRWNLFHPQHFMKFIRVEIRLKLSGSISVLSRLGLPHHTQLYTLSQTA